MRPSHQVLAILVITTIAAGIGFVWTRTLPAPAAPATIDLAPAAHDAPVTTSAERQPVATPLSPGHVRVHAVLAGSGEPVPDADVWYRPAIGELGESIAAKDAENEGLRKARTDAYGRASVPAKFGTKLRIRSAELYGEVPHLREAPADAAPYRVELVSDARLVVIVSDTEGRPAPGIPVIAEGEHRDPWSGGIGRFHEDLGISDATGRIEVPHLQCLIPWRDRAAADWRLRLVIPLAHLADRACDVATADVERGEPIRLVVPAGGTIEVDLTDDQGVSLPFDDEILATRFARRPGEPGPMHGEDAYVTSAPPVLLRPAGMAPQPIAGHLAANGRVVTYRQVPLGGTWEFTAQTERLDCRLPIRGPAEIATPVRMHVPMPFARCEVRGRLLTAEREPIAGVAAWIRIDGGRDEAVVPSASDGSFVTALAVPGNALPIRDADIDLRGQEYTGAVPLGLLAGGTTDLGDVIVPETFRHGPPRRDPTKGEVHGTDLVATIVPPPVPWASLWASLTPVGSDSAAVALPEEHGFGLTFVWSGLEPSGACTVRIHGQHTLLHETQPIELRAGSNVWPEDGTALDLRGVARSVTVSARTGTGEPLCSTIHGGTTASLFTVPREGDAETMLRFGSSTFDGGRAAAILTTPPSDLIVAARHHIPLRLVAPGGDIAVSLRATTEVVLYAPAGDGIALGVVLVDDGLRDPWLRAAAKDTDAEALGLGETTTWRPTVREPDLRLHLIPDAVLDAWVERESTRSAHRRITVPADGPLEIRF